MKDWFCVLARRMRMASHFLFKLLVVLTLNAPLLSTAADLPLNQGKPRVLRFVTYAAERPTEELRKMEPFQRHLEAQLNVRGHNVRIELRIFSTYGEAQDAIYNGNFDFARIGPANYVLAKDRKAPVRLLVVESHKGDGFFQGAIMTRSDSSIQTVADLKGKRFAFGDLSSTTGRYLPQALLVQSGIKASDLASYEYVGRHDKVVMAVAADSFDAGASNERTIEKYAARGLKKLVTFATPTQPWVVNTKLDGRLVDAMRLSLLQMNNDALKYIDRDGFLPGREVDYDNLRKAMRVAEKFGG